MVVVATDAQLIAEQTDTSHLLEMQHRCALTGAIAPSCAALAARGAPIYENGIGCRDMIRMAMHWITPVRQENSGH